MNCKSCDATTTNGLALCESCRIAAAVIFEFVPVYFRNLARWRPGRAGSRTVPSSREPRDPSTSITADPVMQALNTAGADMTTWAKRLNTDRGVTVPEQGDEAATVAALCRLFTEHLTSIATLEWCGEFLQSMSNHEMVLRQLTERVAPGWYAGGCKQCGYATHVIPDLTWVTCGSCGATTYARDHLDTIMDEARGWVARPRPMAEVLVALVDTELSVVRLYERIKKWEQREKITGIRRLDEEGDEVGPKRYRLGDVLDRLLSEGSTRLHPVVAEDPSAAS